MVPALAMTAAQLSALIFIAILIVAGVVVMGLTADDILNSRSDHDPNHNEPPTHQSGGSDTLYKGVVVILLIGLVGAVVTAVLH